MTRLYNFFSVRVSHWVKAFLVFEVIQTVLAVLGVAFLVQHGFEVFGYKAEFRFPIVVSQEQPAMSMHVARR